MRRFKSPLAIACFLVTACAALLGISLLPPGIVLAWLVNGLVFGIPALISVAFFAFFGAVSLRWLIEGHGFQGYPPAPSFSRKTAPGTPHWSKRRAA